MPKRQDNYKITNVVRAATTHPWAILPEKLDAIEELLTLRAAGERLEPEEVRARIGVGQSQEDQKPRVVNGVAVIPMVGVMAPRMNLMMQVSGGCSTQMIAKHIAAAKANNSIRAIVLAVNSPGGSVLGLQDLADAIHAARGSKPIKTVCDRGEMASACYYAGSGSDEVIASVGSFIGSIGAVMRFTETFEADAMEGKKKHAIARGEFKGAGMEGKLDDKTRVSMQRMVDTAYDNFIATVARNRELSAEEIEKNFGQGQMFTAAEALERKMIDRIATLDEVIEELSAGGGQRFSTNSPSASAIPSTPLLVSEFANVNKVIAALYAMGLIDSQEIEASAAEMALSVAFRSRGLTLPETEEEILAALAKFEDRTPAEPPAPKPQPETSAADVRALLAAERVRVAEIRAAADLLSIDEADLEAAIAGDQTIEAVRSEFLAKAAKEKKPLGRIEHGTPAMDTFVDGACDALLAQNGFGDGGELSQAARELSNISPAEMCGEFVRLSGGVASRNVEENAKEFLKAGGEYMLPSADGGGTANRAGSTPNLLSNLAGKVLNRSLDLSEVTYAQWTSRMADIADFKEKAILETGYFDQLDQIQDTQLPRELTFTEEMPSYIQIGQFANRVGLTPVMMVNDDLDAFMLQLQTLMNAHERTLNRLAIALVAGNVAMLDAVPLYHASHNNLVTGGGAPSSTQFDKMRKLQRQMPGVGGVGKVAASPRVVLVPSEHETASEQTLLRTTEGKSPETDANINPFRGRMRPVVEPELDDYSTTAWYSFLDPARHRSIVHAFQRGYSRGGKRETYWEPGTNTRWFRLEGRFAAAIASYRGTIKNPGQ